MSRHDIAIYAPAAAPFYDAAASSHAGGAERQTWLLARNMAERGLRVAHVVFPVAEPVRNGKPPVTLVERQPPDAHGTVRDFVTEARAVRRDLARADAKVHVFRGATGGVGIGALWARGHGRRIVFAGANNSDFQGGPFPGPRDPRSVLFHGGMRLVDHAVVQSADQQRLARERFPNLGEVEWIPSFAAPAPATDAPGEAFLWVSRLADYKQPLLYADLAAAVPEARFWMVAIETPEPGFDDLMAELRRRAAELPNFELLPQRSHGELQELIGSAIAMVNTSSFEGMPNTWLEGWSRGVPALTYEFDPDGRIEQHGLGVSARGDWEAFASGARRLWEQRADRAGFSPVVRGYVDTVHGTQVADRWAATLERLAARSRG